MEHTTGKSRFATPVSEEEFCDAANGVVPLNMKKNNCWAQRTLNALIKERNKVNPGSVLTDFLSCNERPCYCVQVPPSPVPPSATLVRPILQLPNCAIQGICSTGGAFDVVRIHTTNTCIPCLLLCLQMHLACLHLVKALLQETVEQGVWARA